MPESLFGTKRKNEAMGGASLLSRASLPTIFGRANVDNSVGGIGNGKDVDARRHRRRMPKFMKKATRWQQDPSDASSSSSSSLKQPSFHRYKHRRNTDFEVLRGLQNGQRYTKKPSDFKSELLLKTTFGYKKKICLLTEGRLKVYRRSKHIPLGRIRFIVDLGLSVVSHQEFTKCISINADDEIYRFKAPNENSFNVWVENLHKHRLYRQDQVCYGSISTRQNSLLSIQEFVPGIPLTDLQFEEFNKINEANVEKTKEQRVVEWLNKNEDLSTEADGIPKLKTLFFELNSLLVELEKLTDEAAERKIVNSTEVVGSPKSLRKRSKFRLSFRSRKSKENIENGKESTNELVIPSARTSFSISNPEMNNVGIKQFGPLIKGNSVVQLKREISDLYHKETYLKEEYLRVARETYKGLGDLLQKCQLFQHSATRQPTLPKTSLPQMPVYKTVSVPIVVNTVSPSTDNVQTDSAMFKTARDDYAIEIGANKAQLDSRNSLSPYRNTNFKESSASELSDLDSEFELQNSDFPQMSPFHDTLSSSSPETLLPKTECRTHRDRLPVAMTQSNFSVWSILKNAIGKDLSKISFPIEIFEPLSMLQVLCEELEYSDLLDQAAQLIEPFLRMAYVAAFAVSRYASTATRAQRKPFNPLEGETFENHRDDLGWWFVAEQVSHHPAVSACHAKGRGWEMWQNFSCNLVYWGKSIQAEPTSLVHANLSNFQETYQWNKVVATVHNLFGGTRYVEHYGDLVIKCSSGVTCKMFFKRANGAHKHDFNGHIYDSENRVVHTVHGKWSESFNLGAQTVWKANDTMPDYADQFGFTKFAVSLNEITDELKSFLPTTDSRFRPDQRALEEGDLEEAKKLKTRLETNQRNRRKFVTFQPKWFDHELHGEKTKVYKFNNRYWQARNHGFAKENFESLW